MTRGQNWRRKRNLVVAAAALKGASVRFLADVFDLNPSGISKILEAYRGEDRQLREAQVRQAIQAMRKSSSSRVK